MRNIVASCAASLVLFLTTAGASAQTNWTYEEVRDPYEDRVSRQAIGATVQGDTSLNAIAIVCEDKQLAIVYREETALNHFGLITISYRFDTAPFAERTWVYGNGQASSFDDALTFAEGIVAHERLEFRIEDGPISTLGLAGAGAHVSKVMGHCGQR